MSVRIFHNPHCSKSRQALAILQEHGIEVDIVEYLTQPPSTSELTLLLAQLGLNARELMRHDEAIYQILQLDNPTLDEETLIAAMTANPILIQRPIAVSNGKAIIARPPERLHTLLGGH
ncbi:arsenate reductase (glutaredoxin) [Chitinivorax sp. B]|uniref:arsenate reductase (glutaredoxin) n=1 Tax=Chitinivorax sp. B TaxID=2502235 RepID=UPI0010F4DE9D|nr:arsenate reductase (glutaredoxin) [Chitinivorax sp. B]